MSPQLQRLVGVAALVLAACGGGDDDDDDAVDPDAGGGGGADAAAGLEAPVPPDPATLTASGIGATVMSVSWERASDDATPQAELEYLLYYSTADDVGSLADAEANGTAAGTFAVDQLSVEISGLDSETTYYFNVVVRDGDGMKAAYDSSSAATRPLVELVANLRTDGGIPGSSLPRNFTVFQDRLYFTAVDDTAVSYLWVYDGENPPTKVEKNAGSEMIVFQDELYMSASLDADGDGAELYRYDGTNPIEQVADIYTGAGSSSPKGFVVFDGKLYFAAEDSPGDGELWVYDGATVPNMVFDINTTGTGVVAPGGNQPLGIVYGGELVFAATNGLSNNGVELWSYDGVAAPAMIDDINTGIGSSSPSGFTELDTTMYFAASDGTDGAELWQYTGTGAPTPVADIDPTAGVGSGPTELTVYDGALYFAASGSFEQGQELYVYTGGGSPSLVYEFLSGFGEGGYPVSLVVFDGKLYMGADGAGGRELYAYDGTGDPVEVADIKNADGSNPVGMTEFQGALYFAANDGVAGEELWRLNR